jgi:hypothetical protein
MNMPFELLFSPEAVKSTPALYVVENPFIVNWIELAVTKADVKLPDPKAKVKLAPNLFTVMPLSDELYGFPRLSRRNIVGFVVAPPLNASSGATLGLVIAALLSEKRVCIAALVIFTP